MATKLDNCPRGGNVNRLQELANQLNKNPDQWKRVIWKALGKKCPKNTSTVTPINNGGTPRNGGNQQPKPQQSKNSNENTYIKEKIQKGIDILEKNKNFDFEIINPHSNHYKIEKTIINEKEKYLVFTIYVDPKNIKLEQYQALDFRITKGTKNIGFQLNFKKFGPSSGTYVNMPKFNIQNTIHNYLNNKFSHLRIGTVLEQELKDIYKLDDKNKKFYTVLILPTNYALPIIKDYHKFDEIKEIKTPFVPINFKFILKKLPQGKHRNQGENLSKYRNIVKNPTLGMSQNTRRSTIKKPYIQVKKRKLHRGPDGGLYELHKSKKSGKYYKKYIR